MSARHYFTPCARTASVRPGTPVEKESDRIEALEATLSAPCPSCGDAGAPILNCDGHKPYAICDNCGWRSPAGDTAEEAVESWNRRRSVPLSVPAPALNAADPYSLGDAARMLHERTGLKFDHAMDWLTAAFRGGYTARIKDEA